MSNTPLPPDLVNKMTELDKKYNPQTQQLTALQDIASIVHELLNVADGAKSNTDQIKALGAILDDSRQQLVALNNKEAPQTVDYATPVVDAVNKLSREINAQLAKIDVKPQVNVPAPQVNVEPPQVSVTSPSIDLKGIEKILKSDIPKAFEKSISQIPQPTEPDQQPILDALSGLEDWLKSIDKASRMKPVPGTIKVTNPDGSIISGGGSSGTQYTDGSATITHPIGTIPVFDKAGTITAVSAANPLPTTATITGGGDASAANQTTEITRLTSIRDQQTDKSQFTKLTDGTDTALVTTAGEQNVLESNSAGIKADTATIVAKDFATQTTLALIKAKTDNLDVALSTRTKPADAQHVIVDSGVTTGLTDTQLRATPVPVSGTVAVTGAGDATAANQTTLNTEVGIVTETVPATDTASSGLNGRLQRIAQRLTSIIALLPGSLGQKARAASLAVTLSTEDITAITPPAALTNYANETGGNLATLAGAIASGVAQTNLKQVNGIATQTGTGAAGTGTQRVAVASDSSIILAAGSATIGALTANQSVNNAQVSGTATSVNSGNKDAGTQRVVIATDQPSFSTTTAKKMATTGTTSTVAGSASAIILLAANSSRVSADIANDSTALLYVKKGSAASTTDFTYLLNPASATAAGGLAIIDDYSGILTGVWASATGNARITENT